ncbi:hypothetical protein EDC04DRAFT_1510784 [Pisolithus marmoratus]|nr:hypothetical protein EDC04DRAFT_1510784 [Pisolithus marmoratus]
MLLDLCAAQTGNAAVDRNVQPIGVTTADIHSVLYSTPNAADKMASNHCTLITLGGFFLGAALGQSDIWSCGRYLGLFILFFRQVSEYSATIPIFPYCTAEAPPPGLYVLNSDRDIVLLRGAGHEVTSLTRGEAVVPFDALPSLHLLVVRLLLLLVIAVFFLLCRSMETFSMPPFSSTMEELIILQFFRELWNAWTNWRTFLSNMKLKNHVFSTRAGGVVFTLLLLRTEKTEEVMNELLSTPNTKAWRKWKTTIVDRIRCQGSFDFNTSDWDDGTWSDTEKGLLIDLFRDAREAHEEFRRYLTESGSTT